MSKILTVNQTVLGRYKITELIGEGGQAIVARGEDNQTNEQVVIKQLRPDELTATRGDKHCERFQREANVIVDNPHLVCPIDSGDESKKKKYIIFPYIDGQDLVQLMNNGWLPKEQDVVVIMIKVCSALDALHRRGWIHRDVKPPNILFNQNSQSAWLIDCGIMHFPELSRLTSADSQIGTPLYIAPELINYSDQLDVRSDLWSLGCTAYRLLTGIEAFDAPTHSKVIDRVLRDEPEFISDCNISLSDSLAQLIHQMMAKDINDRPSSATEVINRLTCGNAPSIAPGIVPPKDLDSATFSQNGSSGNTKKLVPQMARCLACGQVVSGESHCPGCGLEFLNSHYFRMIDEAGRHRWFYIPLGSYKVGRRQIAKSNALISRKQFQCDVSADGTVAVQDLHAPNPTQVDQQPAIVPTLINPKTVLQIADLTGFLVPNSL